MRTLDKFEQAIALAEKIGYKIRYEALAGSSSGVCEFGGSRWIFIDLGLSVDERLDLISEALLADPSLPISELSDDLKSHLGLPARKVAA
jgi:hypothetical protein